MHTETVKAIVEEKEDLLRRHLILSKTVVHKLREKNVIGDFVTKQILGNHQNTQRQVTLLLTSIKTRGVSALKEFLDVLRETFHGWLADDILNAQIEQPDYPEKRVNVINVRDVINKYFTSVSLANEDLTPKEIGSLKGNNRPVNYVIPDSIPYEQIKVKEARLNDKQGPSGVHQSAGAEERDNHMTQIPGSLRDLQKIFDSESTCTRKSIAVLQQEELTIKALLQQNLREQQELFSRQDALNDIRCQMKQISESATQLYRPEPEVSHSGSRLRLLQKTFWSSYPPQ